MIISNTAELVTMAKLEGFQDGLRWSAHMLAHYRLDDPRGLTAFKFGEAAAKLYAAADAMKDWEQFKQAMERIAERRT